MNGARSGGARGGLFIGFDENDIKKELERAFKELDKLHDSVTTADIRRIARKSLKPMVAAYREEATIKGPDSFKVYRNGGVYAEIKSGVLAKSIGVITSKVNRGSTFASLSVGPRVKRSFSDPEKGGWFAHFLEYGYLQDGQYRGDGYRFASRARMKAAGGVGNEFKRLMKGFVNRKVKAARI
jgi:predicted Zn-dependent peptidase